MVKKSEDLTMAERLKQAERDAAMWKSKYESIYKRWYVEKFDSLPIFEKNWAALAYKLINWKSPELMTPIARNKFKVKYIEEKEWVNESIYWGKKSWWSKVEEKSLEEVINEIELPFSD